MKRFNEIRTARRFLFPFTAAILFFLCSWVHAETDFRNQTRVDERVICEGRNPSSLVALRSSGGGTITAAESTSAGGAGDAMAILKRMKELLEPEGPSLRRVVFSMSAEGETVQKVAGMAVKNFPDGKRMLLVMLAPDDVKGVAFLIHEMANKTDVMWVYFPIIRRVREIKSIDQNEHFLGTDFTYADLGFINLHEHYKLLGTEEHNGVRAYKVEEKAPQEPLYFSKVITWISTKSQLPIERDYYDPAGERIKTERFKDVTVVDGVPTALRIVMKDEGQGFITVLDIREVDYEGDLPDELFKPENLSHIASHGIWKANIKGLP